MKKNPVILLATLALSALLASPQAVLAADAAASGATGAAPAAPSAPEAPAPHKPHKLKITIKADVEDSTAKSAGAGDADRSTDEGGKDEGDSGRAVVGIGHDSNLPAGEHAQSVVAVLGSTTSAGKVDEAVVAVLGNARATGPVGDSVVAVLGNTYVDNHVGDSVVAVLGNVELGPHAEVGGDVIAVGGELIRDPAAIVHGEVQDVSLFGKMGGFEWLHPWIRHCLLLGRPLAFAPGVGWAWALALGFIALYLFLALLFPKAVNRCARTIETHPGRTVLAAIFTFLAKPIVFLLLFVTVIGMPLVPFLALALYLGGLFGKAVVLAWIGRRVLPARGDGAEANPVLAVLIGGAIALLLYVIPFVGFIAYKVFDILGLGIVVYTLLLTVRANRAAATPPAATASPGATSPESAGAAPADGAGAAAPAASA
ncbi:MAG: hypothetical protein KGL25_10800, partial [Gammaproteobacteria bacterium]|nr:hypothetical protein [Gammaproteobacteria bacterium]